MKFNKKALDLARKLDYMEIEPEDRKRMIKKCVNPLYKIFYGSSLTKKINNCYEEIKEHLDELEKQRIEYEKLFIEKRREYQKLSGEIRYIALQN